MPSTPPCSRRWCWWSAVIFLFLRNWRATLIPFVTIPVSLIGAFIFLYGHGLHHQHADPAGAGAGHRSGGGRRHRDAGKHLPPHRRRHAAVRGGAERLKGDRLRGAGDDPDAGRGVCAAGLCRRQHRQAVHRICADRGGVRCWYPALSRSP